MQNSVISIRITNLYGSQPSSVVFACKAATFGSELQLSMCTRLRLLICECKTACLDAECICCFCMQNSDFRTRITSLYGSQTSPMFFAFKTATLAPELQVSMGPSPHLWFLHAKLRLLDQKYKSLWVPDFA